MEPLTIYAIIALIAAFGVGYFAGKRASMQRTHSFVDPDVAEEASEKGHAAVERRIAKRKTRILELARKVGKVTNDDVEDMFCISDTTARNYLNELEAADELIQVGDTGRGVYYKPR